MQIYEKNYIKVCFKKTYYSFFHDTDIRKKKRTTKSNSLVCGTTWNRTRDTRIFSPLLYQLSYGTFTYPLIASAKIVVIF